MVLEVTDPKTTKFFNLMVDVANTAFFLYILKVCLWRKLSNINSIVRSNIGAKYKKKLIFRHSVLERR